MECNKEEASRAKDLAEKKMQCKDFVGARKIALKAQQLFPYLENISQVLTVCEVHCSAEIKVNGEMDWYKILQVQPSADESSIKKQYRKLALVLHPDKNQFAGAEAAFKLIGEAQMTLLDRAKRHLYDIKRNGTVKTIPPRQSAHQARNSRTNFSTVNFNGLNQQQQQQQSSFAAGQTFWTMCPACGMRYQYYRSILNKALRCQNCLKPFIAHDLSAKAVPSGVNTGHQWTNTGNPMPHIPVPPTSNANYQSQHASSSFGPHGHVSGTAGSGAEQRGQPAKSAAGVKVDLKSTSANEAKFTNADSRRKPTGKSSNANVGQKRGRKVVEESSDSFSSDSDSSDDVEDVSFKMNYESTSAPRRSSRRKQNVIYREARSDDDDDFTGPNSKRSRDGMDDMTNDEGEKKPEKDILHEEKLPNGAEKDREDVMHGSKDGSSVASNVASGLENLANQQHTFNYPDPEFYDFEKLRNATQFAVDQIWAIYDNVDGMPRFYARIRKVETPDFRIRFTWLEYNAADETEIAWSDAELPVACGNYRLGKSESSEDLMMFSHVVSCVKVRKRNLYDVYPRTGEVWALFKDWNISWSSKADSQRVYEYEVVEVLSDFSESSGISVIPLVKIEGFVSLFIRAKGAPCIIPPAEILKFSHNVPYYPLTGTERDGLPLGCVELDCASLPVNFSEVFPSVGLDAVNGSANISVNKGSCSDRKEVGGGKSQKLHNAGDNIINLEEDDVPTCKRESGFDADEKHKQNAKDLDGSNEKDAVESDRLSPMPASPITVEFPDSEFHNFEDDKKIENFEQGQVWALYSDIDQYPKYYGYIKKVDVEKCQVNISWLESCSQKVEEKRWLENDMPISTGIFKVARQSKMYDTTDTFSHLVVAEQIAKAQFSVLPRLHEIWAVYKNWNVGWSVSDVENCEYDVVEIFEKSGSGIEVNILSKVDGYRAVFRRDGNPASKMVIPTNEYIRFSHRIPEFLLTNERGGKLMGCWELDTASVPQLLLFSSSE